MKKSVLINPSELSERWIERAAKNGIEVLAIHPEGGLNAADSLKNFRERLETAEFRSLLDKAAAAGLEIEYEMHAASYLLDRSLFAEHPEYFRMEDGARTPELNFCPSNAKALEIVSRRAAELALSLYRSNHTFYFWMDDVCGKKCGCPDCAQLSMSDQQLTVLNSMLREIRRVIPDARLAYLAYFDTMIPPETVRPDEGIFLEYAPFEKYTNNEGSSENAERERKMLKPLIDFFGAKGSRALEYYLDNSLFSGWKKPPKKFICAPAETIRRETEEYRALGFEETATFACYLGDDYTELYGEPDISPFAVGVV